MNADGSKNPASVDEVSRRKIVAIEKCGGRFC